MNIVFIGCVKGSAVFLQELISNKANVVGVVTKESSLYNSDFCDLAPLCQINKIDYYYTQNANDEHTVNFIRSKKPDVIYCFGWSQLIKSELLSIPPKGIIGFHPAALPHNRGRHPLIWALVLGLEETASTFFVMDSGADTGRIISQHFVPVYYEDNAQTLYDRVLNIACEQLRDFTEKLALEKIQYINQNQYKGNVWRKRKTQDGKIDWRMSSRAIYNLVRGLTRPYVGAHFEYNGENIKVWKVEECVDLNYSNIESGKIIEYHSKTNFFVKAYDNIIHVLDCDGLEASEGDYLY